jgi:hypothetical protein
MQVAIGPLARAGLETQAGGDLGAAVRAALLFYIQRLQNGRPPTRYPEFLARGVQADPETTIEIDVDEAVELEFGRQAAAQETTVRELAGHAVLLYLAQLDLVDERSAAVRRA